MPASSNTLHILLYISIAVIAVSLFLPCRTSSIVREGYNMMAGTENTISKTDFYAILNEMVNNINGHEIILHTMDPEYTMSEIKVDPKLSDMENIQNLLSVLKKQDKQISKLVPSYLPNSDLDGLMDGSLYRPLALDLKSKSTYPENPLDCNPEAMKKALRGYQDIIAATNGDDDNSKTKRMVVGSMATQLQMKIVDYYAYITTPGNTKCLPPLSPTDAEGILDGYYANSLSKIVKSHDIAISTLQNKIQANVVGFYSATM